MDSAKCWSNSGSDLVSMSGAMLDAKSKTGLVANSGAELVDNFELASKLGAEREARSGAGLVANSDAELVVYPFRELVF